jgi:hypothetical protein
VLKFNDRVNAGAGTVVDNGIATKLLPLSIALAGFPIILPEFGDVLVPGYGDVYMSGANVAPLEKISFPPTVPVDPTGNS